MSNSKPISTKNSGSSIIPFAVSLVAAPIWLFLLVPSTIVLKLLTNIYDHCKLFIYLRLVASLILKFSYQKFRNLFGSLSKLYQSKKEMLRENMILFYMVQLGSQEKLLLSISQKLMETQFVGYVNHRFFLKFFYLIF